MKPIAFACTGLLTGGALLGLPASMAIAQGTQPIPEPQQNDNRPPLARINPQKPIQIRLVSQTNVPVVASTIEAGSDRMIAPGKTVTIGRLHTRYLTLPLDVQVTLKDTPDPNKPIRLFLDVKTAGNEVIVNVRTGFTGIGNSSQAISINETGAIFLY